jgi:hypothetical protein
MKVPSLINESESQRAWMEFNSEETEPEEDRAGIQSACSIQEGGKYDEDPDSPSEDEQSDGGEAEAIQRSQGRVPIIPQSVRYMLSARYGLAPHQKARQAPTGCIQLHGDLP